jgi:hypothetical protein
VEEILEAVHQWSKQAPLARYFGVSPRHAYGAGSALVLANSVVAANPVVSPTPTPR